MKLNLHIFVLTAIILVFKPLISFAQEEGNPSLADTLIDSKSDEVYIGTPNNCIEASDFPENVNLSVFEILQGRINGGTMSIYSNGLDVNVNSIVRGSSDYSIRNYPVLVIDGLISPYEDEFLDIENIESISFIKGAAASALYGARGDGGIIRITTKQSGAHQPFKLHYHGSTALGAMPETVPVLSADAFRETVYNMYGEDSEAAALLGNANTNWQEKLFRQSISHSHYLGATGTLSKSQIPYRASVKFSDKESNIITDTRTKTAAVLDVNPSFFDNTLKVHLKLNGYLSNGTAPSLSDNIREEAIEFDPTQPVYSSMNPYGPYFFYLDEGGNQIRRAPGNPVAVVNMFGNTIYSEGYVTQMNTDYQLPFYKSVTLQANYSRSYTNRERESVSLNSHSDLTNPDAEKSLSTAQYTVEIFDANINFQKHFKPQNLNVDFILGYLRELRKNKFENISVDGVFDNRSKYYFTSIYSKAIFQLRGKYELLLAARRDGSSVFATDNRYTIFPAASLSWNIMNESFMKKGLLSSLQLQLGYGKTSRVNNELLFSGVDSQNVGTDKDLRMPVTTTKDAELFFGMLNNRISGSLSFYKKQSEDLLLRVPVPGGNNLINYILTNSGEIENKGFEFSLNAAIIQKEKVSWDFGFNLSKNKNEIIKIVENQSYGFVGGPINGSFDNVMMYQPGNPVASFFLYEQVYDSHGNPIEGMFTDQNGNGEIDDGDRRVAGNTLPDFSIGFHSRLTFKNMELSFSGRAWQGNDVYNNIASQFGYTNRIYNGSYLLNALENSPFESPQYLSDYYLEDASFVKVDNITFSYSIPEIWEQKMDLKLYLSVYNALTITNYSGIDPEIYDGIDSYIDYPSSRVFMLGVKADF